MDSSVAEESLLYQIHHTSKPDFETTTPTIAAVKAPTARETSRLYCRCSCMLSGGRASEISEIVGPKRDADTSHGPMLASRLRPTAIFDVGVSDA